MGSEKTDHTVINIKGKEIAQIGIVVKDAAKTAKRYSEIFGIGPWVFFDLQPTDVIFHDRPLTDEFCARIALIKLGKIQIELLQPLYGPSTYREFYEAHGEGIHHVSFGIDDDHDEIISGFKANGMGIEMQGLLGGAFTFTYMATQKELGTIIEIVKPPPKGIRSTLKTWGTYMPEESGLIDFDQKEIVQIGLVVQNAEEMAKKYWEMMGIGPWHLIDFKPPHLSDGLFHGIPMGDVDMHIRTAITNFGNLQLELLEPISGPSSHMDFLKSHGEGIHHVSLGELEDHDQVLSAFKGLGIETEMTGLLGGATTFTYMATQKDLGTIFEIVKTRHGAENTLTPYGTYPPSQ